MPVYVAITSRREAHVHGLVDEPPSLVLMFGITVTYFIRLFPNNCA